MWCPQLLKADHFQAISLPLRLGGLPPGLQYMHWLLEERLAGVRKGYRKKRELFHFAHIFSFLRFFFFFFFFWSHHPACGILVPWPGIEPGLWQWNHWVLTTGLPRKSLFSFLFRSNDLNISLCYLNSHRRYLGVLVISVSCVCDRIHQNIILPLMLKKFSF